MMFFCRTAIWENLEGTALIICFGSLLRIIYSIRHDHTLRIRRMSSFNHDRGQIAYIFFRDNNHIRSKFFE